MTTIDERPRAADVVLHAWTFSRRSEPELLDDGRIRIESSVDSQTGVRRIKPTAV